MGPLNKTKRLLLNVLFPKKCFGCATEKDWLCEKCQNIIISSQTISQCPVCKKTLRDELGRTCLDCRQSSDLAGIISVGLYSVVPLKNAVHALKYNFAKEVSQDLAQVIAKKLISTQIIFQPKKNILIPVPLHKKREKFRGFNQAEEIAKHLGQILSLPCLMALKRNRHTTPQVELTGHKRETNVANVFEIAPNINLADLEDATIFLIDDVATTGSTLQECAKVLRQYNVKEIWGLVVARG